MRARNASLVALGGLCAVLHCGCGGSDQTNSASGFDATSMSSNTTSATSSSAGGGASTIGATSAGGAPSSSGASVNASVTGGALEWVCLVSEGGCLCSTDPSGPGDATTCSGDYSCCYGLPGSTCYCVDLPEANCQELLDLGYEPYTECPPQQRPQ